MRDCIVIGGGIIGTTVTKALKNVGVDVLLLDDSRPMAGTKPSGGHLKPSWFGGMAKSEYEPALELLDKTWKLHEADFRIWPTPLTTNVFRVDTDVVVKYPKTQATVTSIEHINNYPVVKFEEKEERCRHLVIATGVWVQELFPEVKVVGKQGVSFRFPGKLKEAFIKPWAPYKQVVAHQQGLNEIWVGDGSTILPQNWSEERTEQCLERCRKALGYVEGRQSRILMGIRPYCESGNDPCLLKKVGPRAWVATGAGKSGTIAAGWVARKMLDAIN